MPDPESTSAEFRELLRLLTLLNSSVRFIIVRLNEIASNKVLSAGYLTRLIAASEQVERFLKDHNLTL